MRIGIGIIKTNSRWLVIFIIAFYTIITEQEFLQVNLIDIQSEPDGENKYIPNYQNHLTRNVIFRLLITQTANEVADVLLDIFYLFGAPNIACILIIKT